jgi:hypothetical protein
MRRLVVLVVTLVVAGALAEGAAAFRGTHFVVSNNWQGITFVSGLDSCPLFGATPYAWYAFGNVNLTDQINVLTTPYGEPLEQFDSVGAVHGVINAPDGTYTVAGGGFKEHRLGDFAPWYFSGTGQVTITGPAGTVVGQATFQDQTDDPPLEFDLFFTGITTCRLRSAS